MVRAAAYRGYAIRPYIPRNCNVAAAVCGAVRAMVYRGYAIRPYIPRNCNVAAAVCGAVLAAAYRAYAIRNKNAQTAIKRKIPPP